ncbi:MAG: hypothetical protein AAB944_01305 [Patescibacteria group bacterium]
MDQELGQKLDEQGKKLDAIEQSVKKIRSYLFWTAMVSIILFVLPLIGLLFVVPRFLNLL